MSVLRRVVTWLAMPVTWTWYSVVLLAGLALWGWSLTPDRPARWIAVALFLPALWAFVELMQGGTLPGERQTIMRWHRTVFAIAGLLFGLRLAPQLALASGLLDRGWASVLVRVWWIALGAAVAIWGNYLPKVLSPWPVEDEPFAWQRVHRFAGWVFSLGGVAVAAAWLFLGESQARDISLWVLGAICALAVARKLLSLLTHARDKPPSPQSPARI